MSLAPEAEPVSVAIYVIPMGWQIYTASSHKSSYKEKKCLLAQSHVADIVSAMPPWP